MSDDTEQTAPPSFEQALSGLDDIVARLESGETSHGGLTPP